MGLPTRAWATSGTWLLGEFVTNGGDVYQCVAAGAGATTGLGPSGTGAMIADGAAAVWDFVDSYQPTRWDITIGANAGKNNETAPSAAVAAAAFATDAKPASALINYLFMQVDRMLLWLTNMFGYPNQWTGKQWFSGGIANDVTVDGTISCANLDCSGPASVQEITVTGSVAEINGVNGAGDFGVPLIIDQRSTANTTGPVWIGGGSDAGITLPTATLFRVSFFGSAAETWTLLFYDSTNTLQTNGGTLAEVGTGGNLYSFSTIIKAKAGTALHGSLGTTTGDMAIIVEALA